MTTTKDTRQDFTMNVAGGEYAFRGELNSAIGNALRTAVDENVHVTLSSQHDVVLDVTPEQALRMLGRN